MENKPPPVVSSRYHLPSCTSPVAGSVSLFLLALSKCHFPIHFPSVTFPVSLSNCHFPSVTFLVSLSNCHFPDVLPVTPLPSSQMLSMGPRENLSTTVLLSTYRMEASQKGASPTFPAQTFPVQGFPELPFRCAPSHRTFTLTVLSEPQTPGG